MANANEILVGLVDIYYKAYDATNNPISSDNTISWSGWTQLGYQSEDGLTDTVSTEVLEIEIPDVNAHSDQIITLQTCEFTFSLMENDLAQAALAMPGSTYTAGTLGDKEHKLGIGGKTAEDSFYSWGFVGLDRAGLSKVIFYPKAKASAGSMGRAHQKKGLSLRDFNMKAYIDTTGTAGQQLRIEYAITSA